mgnify:CR=1 FL=1
MDLHTESGVVSIEKNEVVTLVENPKTAKNAEIMEVKREHLCSPPPLRTEDIYPQLDVVLRDFFNH